MAREISTRPVPVADVTAWDEEADVVVVGFGHAGAAAASAPWSTQPTC